MKIAFVVWDDSESHDPWEDLLDLKGPPAIVRSVGFLLEEHEEYVVIVQNHDIKNEKGSMTMTIPMSCVLEIHFLEAPNVDK